MWNWLMDHLATILISLALLAVVVLIVRHFVRQKKREGANAPSRFAHKI